MPLKNTVALERRIDLASFFCMIGRHGPAVALALVAMGLFLAGCRIYRRFREKRRKNADTADDRDGNAGLRDAALGLWEEDEPRAEGIRRYTGSTDGSYESSQDELKEDTYPSHRPLKVRRRRAAAKRTPNKDKLPDIKYTTSLDKTENSFVWDINLHKAAEPHTEEVSHILESEFTNNTRKEVIEEASGTKEPELIDVGCKEEEKVLEAECSDDITTKEDILEEECRQDEDTSLFTLNNQLCFTQTPELSVNDIEEDNILATETKVDIDQNGLPAPSHHETKAQTDERDALVDREAVDEMVLPPQEVNTAEERRDHHETEPSTFEQDTSSQHANDFLSDTTDQIKGQSSTVESCHKEFIALIPTLEPTDVIKEETCNVTSDFKAEISSIPEVPSQQTAPQTENESLEYEQNTSLQQEQFDQLGVSPVQCSHSVNHDKFAREKDTETLNEGVIDEKQGGSEADVVYLNTAAQCKTASEPVSGVTTSNAPEQKEPKTQLDKDSDKLKEIEILAENNGNSSKQEVINEALTANVHLICDDEFGEGNISHPDKQTTKVLDHKDINETAELVACDRAIVTAPAVIEDMSPPSPDQKHAEDNLHFEMTSGASPVFAHVRDLPVVPDQLLSLEQMKLEDDCLPSLGLAGESGISSMTVSPDLEEASEEIGAFVASHLPLEYDPMLLSHDPLAACKPFIDDAVAQVTNEEPVTRIFGPLSSSPVQLSPPENQDISDESLATNEDTFGSEVEDSYYRAADEFLMQVLDNVLNIKDEVEKQTEQISNKVEEKKTGVCVVKKEEGEKAEDCEKTEISIMEATMDHNEWITDGNYQVPPWMNVLCFSKDGTSEESTDIFTSVENKFTAVTPIPEENTENAKRVLAVQPMPQNVNVTFRIHYLTLSPYQTVAVTGDQQELGLWKSVVPLERAKDGYWSCMVSLPAESHVEWKFVVLEKGEVCRWEECGNRLLYTGYGDDLLVHKWWGFL